MDAEHQPTAAKTASFAGTAGLVMVAFVLSRALGLLREALLGSAFGAGAALDAFRAASRVTDTLYLLIAGGALGSAFIPTFTAYLAHGRRQAGWEVASAVTNLVALLAATASLLTALFAPWLVARVLAPGYDAPTQALTVSLLRQMLPSTVIFGVSGLLMGILNANDRFLLPALAPSLYNLGIIGGVVVGHGRWGVHSAALGTVAGALGHLLIQLPALRRLDWRYRPILGLRLAGVREVGRLMGPRVLGMAITQLNFWVNVNLGSRIPVEGVVSALTYGWLLMLLPQGVFAQAIAVVLFPTLSAHAARDERAPMRHTLGLALRALLYLTLPATVGLIVLRRPLVALLFLRGAFDLDAVAMVSWALAWYAIGLVAHSELEVVTRAFYALHDTATPVWVGGGAMVVNVGLSLLLTQLFQLGGHAAAPWTALGGLALANSLATIGETAVLAMLIRRRLGGLEGEQLWASTWRAALGAAAMGLALSVLLRTMPAAHATSALGAWVLGGGGMLLGAAVYGFCTLLLGSPEIDLVLAAVRRRWGR
ncbi:MAG: murein biosynthesis integral membrane protein MurJ [Anaerolineae bacterium]|nr:murein biosynthesis integral membrane protein MurJ [Anaerolineae bacterium]